MIQIDDVGCVTIQGSPNLFISDPSGITFVKYFPEDEWPYYIVWNEETSERYILSGMELTPKSGTSVKLQYIPTHSIYGKIEIVAADVYVKSGELVKYRGYPMILNNSPHTVKCVYRSGKKYCYFLDNCFHVIISAAGSKPSRDKPKVGIQVWNPYQEVIY